MVKRLYITFAVVALVLWTVEINKAAVPGTGGSVAGGSSGGSGGSGGSSGGSSSGGSSGGVAVGIQSQGTNRN